MQDVPFHDKPIQSERDEIKMRKHFYYQQAFFHRTGALMGLNISDVYWVEDNVARITNSAASSHRTNGTGGDSNTTAMSLLQEKIKPERIYESAHYCLNVNYRKKGQKKFQPLHSYDPSYDFYERSLTDAEKKERI